MAKWNEAQQAVLDSLQDHNNILVSAAAGSGKTAVLVERILRSVREGLCHVDEILVVTFTRAAAAEMKTRILNGLTKMAEDNPTKEMYREMSLANSADITTIDSFCNSVVRENFHLAGVDPAFQIYDSEEAELLKRLIEAGLPVHGFSREKGSLESIFMQLTGHGEEHTVASYAAETDY